MKRLFALLFLLSCSFCLNASAQAAKPAPPLPPSLLSFHYWPNFFIQWLGDESPYSTVEAYVDPNPAHPIYEIVLAERASHKRLHFTNQPEIAERNKFAGEETHVTPIKYTAAENDSNGGVYNFQFAGPEGKSVQWRFVQGSDLTEKASGLTEMSQLPFPYFFYREIGAVAGEGSVIQIGEKLSEAALWKEISVPPYFIAYHGARSAGIDTLSIYPGEQNWKIDEAPASLTIGAKWKLTTQNGAVRLVEIKQASGDSFAFQVTEERNPGQHLFLTAKKAGEGWLVDSMRIETDAKSEQHGFTLRFQTPLPVNTTSSVTEVKFDLLFGKKNKVGSGSFAISRATTGASTYLLQFKSPDWLQKKSFSDELHYESDTIAVTAKLK